MNILKIHSSARLGTSRSRQLSNLLAERLLQLHPESKVIERDLAKGLTFITDEMIANYYVPEDVLTAEQKATLEPSDKLVNELIDSDVIIIGAPMYNFTISGSLKTYIDQICRLGKTFSTNPQGFEGLLNQKIVYLITTTGGTPIGSSNDFMSAYLRQVLGFIGLTDIRQIIVDKLDPVEAENAMANAKQLIKTLSL
ncbi:MAG: FMN-dependent NADH-azoreductase [Arenicella sp.]